MKNIVNYPRYKVSPQGHIWSANNTSRTRAGFKKLTKNSKGYLKVGLARNGQTDTFLVHRLVAEAFLPNPENKPQVNHINGIKTDNRVENLEWCTNGENMEHAKKEGLVNNKGSKNGKSKLTESQVLDIRRALMNGATVGSIAKQYNLNHVTISDIKYGRTWVHCKVVKSKVSTPHVETKYKLTY